MKLSKIFLSSLIIIESISCIPFANSVEQSSFVNEQLQILKEEKNVDNIYRVYYPNNDLRDKAVISFHNQLMETNKEEGYLVIELSSEDIKKLTALQFKLQPATDFIKQRNLRIDQMTKKLQMGSVFNATPSSIPDYACYETVEETFDVAQSLATNHPDLATWKDIGDSWEKSEGFGGYDIKVLVLTNKENDFEKPKLFVNSAIHAREYATAPLNLKFARWLVEGYETNADARWILDHHEVHLLLHLNPDGRKKAEAGSSWRKNANQNYCGSSSAFRGADLNRNFSDRWNITDGNGSSGNTCNETYRGPSAASEPEIQAIENYMRSIFPDSRGPNDNDAAPDTTSGMHIDIHSYGGLVLWPWGDKQSSAPNGTQLQTLGRKFAFFNDYEPKQSIGLYATDGTSDNISYSELGVPAFIFELGDEFFQDCATFENSILPDNLKALIYAAKVVRTPYITPAGPDVANLTLSDDASSAGIPAGTVVEINAQASDLRFSSNNGTETTQNIADAEYYIDVPPWQSGASAHALNATDGSFNNKTESITGSIDTSNLSVGEHIVYVRSKDSSNTFGAVSAVFLKITDGTPPPVKSKFTFQCSQLSCEFNSSDSTGEITNWSWNFGDGSTNTKQNPTHEYADYGTYKVTLTVTDDDGNEDTISENVVVSDKSEFELDNGVAKNDLSGNKDDVVHYFINVPAGATNLVVKTSANNGDADLYLKQGSKPSMNDYDCRPYNGGSNETCTVDSPVAGTYYVMIHAYSAYDNLTLTASYDGEPDGPNADFTPTVNGLTVEFKDKSTGAESWSWNFGDGTNSNSQNPSHTYSKAGTYSVELTVTDADGNSDTATQSVTVSSDTPDDNCSSAWSGSTWYSAGDVVSYNGNNYEATNSNYNTAPDSWMGSWYWEDLGGCGN